MIYPDYGALMLSLGYSDVLLDLYDVPITRLALIRPGLFAININTTWDGVEYAVAFDLPMEQLVAISRLPRIADGDRVLMLASFLGQGESMELPAPWFVTLSSRLGSPEHSAEEMFIPLVVEQVS
jgi:hypothetical protein